jgi:micrococcal nuclease
MTRTHYPLAGLSQGRNRAQAVVTGFLNWMIAILLVAAFASPAKAGNRKSPESVWQGVVTHVSDGDTLWVQPAAGGGAVKIRLDGIDAPEICQAWGLESRAALGAFALHQPVSVRARAHDKFGRVIASVMLQSGAGGVDDAGQWQVQGGHAWANQFRRYRSRYGAVQAQAQSDRRGLWSAARPQLPSAFRKQHGPCASHS